MERKGIPKMSDRAVETPSPAAQSPAAPRHSRLRSRYHEDHKNPVNHFLHVGVGWPTAAIAVIMLPFKPGWALGLFALAYAIMFIGHFVFERNIPTIFREPTTPFVMAFTVVRRMLEAARILPARADAEPVYQSPPREM
jgi:hypothetical protein